jgi:hypothetical protein
MSGINTGILINAKPLSTERIKELEKQVLEKQETFAYLDENSDLCFSMPRGVDNIKDLAWNNAYELSTEANSFTKKAYKKTGLKTFYLDKVLSKQNINDAWGEPERLEGDGQEFYTMAPSTLSFRSTAPLNELQDVQINGQTVDPSNYELEEGSTIVKLKHDYLSTLGTGKYELSVVSDSKTVKGDFTVAAPELNEYGFYYNQPYSVKTAINEELITYTVWFKEDYVYGLTKNSRESATYQYENGIISFNLSFPGGNFYHLSFTGSFSDNGRQILGTGSFLSSSTETTDIVLEMSAQMACADDMYMYVKHNDNSISYFPLYNRAIFYYPLPKTNILGFPITSLYEGAFNGSDVNTVLLPDSLTSISDFAFYHCANLRSITIPSSVTSIGDDAFYGCEYLNDIVIPNGVTTIGNNAFYKCVGFETVTIPNSLTSLGDNPFDRCMSLKTVNYDGTVEQAKTVLASLLSTHWKDTGAYTVYCTDGTINNRGTVTMY